MKARKEPTDPIGIYFNRVHWEYNHLIKVIEHSTKGLNNQKRSVINYYKSHEKKYPEHWHGILEARDEDLYRFDNNYQVILRNSFLIATYSLFESSLLKITRLTDPFSENGKKYQYQKGKSYAEGCKEYLEHEIRLNLNHIAKQWKFLDQFRLVRNQIVHDNSTIAARTVAELRKNKLYKIVSRIDSFKVVNTTKSFRMTDNDYLLEVCKTGRSYLREIVQCYLKTHSI